MTSNGRSVITVIRLRNFLLFKHRSSVDIDADNRLNICIVIIIIVGGGGVTLKKQLDHGGHDTRIKLLMHSVRYYSHYCSSYFRAK